MNKVLERQLKKIFGDLNKVPAGLDELLKLVSATYDNAEEDRRMIERSMEISSRELGQLNKQAREEAEKLKGNLDTLERMNKLMVDRELKMIELKKEIAALKARNT